MTNLPTPGSRVRPIGAESDLQIGVVCDDDESGGTCVLKSCGHTYVLVEYPRLDGKLVWSPLRALESAPV